MSSSEISMDAKAKRASEWAQRSARAKRAVRCERTSERCERMSERCERTSECPRTLCIAIASSQPTVWASDFVKMIPVNKTIFVVKMILAIIANIERRLGLTDKKRAFKEQEINFNRVKSRSGQNAGRSNDMRCIHYKIQLWLVLLRVCKHEKSFGNLICSRLCQEIPTRGPVSIYYQSYGSCLSASASAVHAQLKNSILSYPPEEQVKLRPFFEVPKKKFWRFGL